MILSATSPNPSDMVIKNSENVELEDGALVEIDVNDADDFLIIDVLPSFVQDKEIVYEDSSEEGMTGKVELVKRDGSQNRYAIVPVEAGITKLTVRAASARDVYRTLTFNVTTKEISRFEIYRGTGEETDKPIAYSTKSEATYSGEVKLHAAERFYSAAEPHSAYSALENDIIWQSSDPELASVDSTGLVTPLKQTDERVQITATTYDGSGKQFSVSFTVDLSEALASDSVTYLSDSALFGASAGIIKAWLAENVLLVSEAEIEENDDSRPADGFRSFDVSYDGISVTVRVEYAENDWGFGNVEELIYSGNGYQPFTVTDYSTGESIRSGFTASSDAPDVLKVDAENMHLIPLKAGTATVSLTMNGETVRKTFTVRERPVAFDLTLQKTDGERGIARDRYWGNYWLDSEGNLTKTMYFGIKNDANTFEVRWYVSTGENGETLAELTPTYDGTQSVYVTFTDAAAGQNVTLTAKLYMQGRVVDSMQRSFTFRMLEKLNSVNVYTAADFGKVYDSYPTYDYAMQADIRADRMFSSMMGSVYGNGFLYDAAGITIPDDGDSALRYRWEDIYNRLRSDYFGGATPSKEIMLDLMEEKGIRFTGTSADSAGFTRDNPLVLDVNGMKVALVNFTYGTNIHIQDSYPKVNRISREALSVLMGKARESGADLIIALPHWGEEYSMRHSAAQEDLAEWLADNGADLVIGTHPHVVQDSTVIRTCTAGGREKDIHVIYSLGNSVSNMSAGVTQIGLLSRVTAVKHLNGKVDLAVGLEYLWCSLPGRLKDTHCTIPVKEYLDRRGEWKMPYEYDKMVKTYYTVKEKTGVKD